MSIEVMTFVWKRYPEGGSELLLALALADFADDDGTSIYPSVARMATKTRMSERNIQYLLAKMKERGWLVEVEPGGMRSGRNYATEYKIPMGGISDHLMYGVQTLHPPTRGANQRQKGVQTSAKNLRQVAPHTSLPAIRPVRAQRSAPRRPRSLEERNKAAGEEWLRKAGDNADQ